MTALDRVLAVARAEVGTTERPVNRTKYGVWFGMDGVSWCDIFVSWVFAQAAGKPGLSVIGGKHAYTPDHADWFRQAGRWGRAAKPGALVFYDFPDGEHRIQHVGIVLSALPGGQIRTVEGNTSPGDGGSQHNGGGVYQRERSTAFVVGYGYPDYQQLDRILEDEVTPQQMEALADLTAQKVWRLEFGEFYDADGNGKRDPIATVTALYRAEGAAEDARARIVGVERTQAQLLAAVAELAAAVARLGTGPAGPAGR